MVASTLVYIKWCSMNLRDRRTEGVSSPYCAVSAKLNVYKQVKQVQSRVSIDIIRYAPYVILFEQRHQFLHCCKINQTV